MGSSPLQFPALDAAIAGFENSTSAYNNPMAIQAGSFANSYGAVGTAPNGLAIFSDPSQSNAAGDALLGNLFNVGDNLSQALQNYTGLSTGNPVLTNYTNYVSQQSGIGLNEIPAVQSANTNEVTPANYTLPNYPGIPNPFNPATASQTISATPGGGATAWTAAADVASHAGLLDDDSGTSSGSGSGSGISGIFSGLQNWLSSSTSGFSFGRIGLFVLALIVIAAGVFALKPIERIAESTRAQAGF